MIFRPRVLGCWARNRASGTNCERPQADLAPARTVSARKQPWPGTNCGRPTRRPRPGYEDSPPGRPVSIDRERDGSPPGGRPAGDPRWEPWLPAEAAERLAGGAGALVCRRRVGAGSFRGSQTRVHDDLESAVPAATFPVIRAALADLEFDVAGAGWLWPEGSPAAAVMHQTWGRDRGTEIYRLDVFREPHDGDSWICRRDDCIRRPYNTLIPRSRDPAMASRTSRRRSRCCSRPSTPGPKTWTTSRACCRC
jgi:hypothetical protein